ncbi:MAG: NAD-dependent deacylase [Gammaproteobacteria bacterium]|nr:NAD-dependent deacylase [Gammaproteobacteria bacterium]
MSNSEFDAATLVQSADFTAVLAALAAAKRVFFITGAGISAESGLPTYRGVTGLYNQEHTEDEVPIEAALSGDMLRQRPALTWKYLRQIESGCRRAGFNAAHAAIAELQKHRHVCVLTQNIDGFHNDAGSRNVIEIHGNARTVFCTACDWREDVSDYSRWDGNDDAPCCPGCGDLLRPTVVLFGEMLPSDALDKLYAELNKGFDLVFSVGTSSVFPYIVQPVLDAARQGIPTVEVNPSNTDISKLVDYKFAAPAGVVLPALVNHLASG